MPAHSKIQDEAEAKRWLAEGKTYQWCVDEYLRKYNIETTISLWAAKRRAWGIPRRIVRDDDLIPWAVKKKHKSGHAVTMLRAEARRRAGKELTPLAETTLNAWLRGLERDDEVVHYDPDTEKGWQYLPRRPGIDTDLIRVPARKTGRIAGE